MKRRLIGRLAATRLAATRLAATRLAAMLLAALCAFGALRPARAEAEFIGTTLYDLYPVLQAVANGMDPETGALPPDDYILAYAATYGNYAEEAGLREKAVDGSVWISAEFAAQLRTDSLWRNASDETDYADFSAEATYVSPENGGYRISAIGDVYPGRDLDAYTWLAVAADRYALLFRLTDENGLTYQGYFEVAATPASKYGFALKSLTLTAGEPALTEWVKPELADGEHTVAILRYAPNDFQEITASIVTEDALHYEVFVPWSAEIRLPAPDRPGKLRYYDAEDSQTIEQMAALIQTDARFLLVMEDGEASALTYVTPPEAVETTP